jgi:hypothetical protein
VRRGRGRWSARAAAKPFEHCVWPSALYVDSGECCVSHWVNCPVEDLSAVGGVGPVMLQAV